MFCSKCGNQLPENVKFCTKCGAEIGSADNEKEKKVKGIWKNKKALIIGTAIVLLILVVGVFPAVAGHFIFKGFRVKSNSLTFRLYASGAQVDSANNEVGTVSIPSQVRLLWKTYPVVSIGSGAFEGCSNLTSVDIPDSVKWIWDRAFAGCSSLTSINIPDSVTEIDISTFEGCSSLTSIDIPDGVTKIWFSAFSGCSSLTSIDIPDGVTEIAMSTFSGCSSLTSIDIPDGVTRIESGAFRDCSSLTSINIPDGVPNISYGAFSGCSSLTSVEISSNCEINNDTFPDGCEVIRRQ